MELGLAVLNDEGFFLLLFFCRLIKGAWPSCWIDEVCSV